MARKTTAKKTGKTKIVRKPVKHATAKRKKTNIHDNQALGNKQTNPKKNIYTCQPIPTKQQTFRHDQPSFNHVSSPVKQQRNIHT